jgi:hypothetical protein
MYGTDEPLCNGPVHLSVIGWSSERYVVRAWNVEAKCWSDRQLHVPTASTFDRCRLDFTHAIFQENHWN